MKLNNSSTLFLYGFLIWLIPFVVSFLVWPTREDNPALFESIMPVTIALVVVCCSILYFKKITNDFVVTGMLMGLGWLSMSLALDLLLFSRGPMKMELKAYVFDIGLTYLLIPIISIGFGYLLKLRYIPK